MRKVNIEDDSPLVATIMIFGIVFAAFAIFTVIAVIGALFFKSDIFK